MSNWSNQTKNTTTSSFQEKYGKKYLLSESLFRILCEDGGGILLEQGQSPYSEATKNIGSWSFSTKN
ncbi:MAG: hypothetical protein IPM48_14545 [Saprospiraceae bacterium]|nr:hypothetical protein [Saprospiraceae bacterium]